MIFSSAVQLESCGVVKMVARVSNQRAGQKLLFSILNHQILRTLVPLQPGSHDDEYRRMIRARGNQVRPCLLPGRLRYFLRKYLIIIQSFTSGEKDWANSRTLDNSGKKVQAQRQTLIIFDT